MSNYKELYHLHIPKSGGRSFKKDIINPIEYLLIKNNIALIENTDSLYVGLSGHNQWVDAITNSTYIICTFRDPVKHLVSLYCHSCTLDSNGEILDNVDLLTKPNFLNWVEKNKNNLVNYQSRHIISSKTDSPELFPQNLLFVNDLNKDLVLHNIKRINMFFKLEEINFNNVEIIKKTILKDLQIDIHQVPTLGNSINLFDNKYSKNLYNSLTNEEINSLYAISPIDFEIYNNNSLFWRTS